MGSERFPLQSKGIFHSLPTFDPAIKGKTAVITGANGISGFHTLRVLLESPARWTKIWSLSRRPPPAEMMKLLPREALSRVEHVACDFLADPKDIAKKLQEKGVDADVVFFYSYVQPTPKDGAPAWSNAQELCDVNTAILRNFLQSLDAASIKPSRFLLQTGAKNYNVHQGPSLTPYIESNPRNNIEPNFYYPQEDLLHEYCNSHRGCSWNIICPAWIIGAVSNASMNALLPFTIYAAVQSHKGERLDFPGVYETWVGQIEHSSAYLTGYLSEWAVLEDKCKNQKFNASDCCPISNNRIWHEIARWFGTTAVNEPDLDDSKATTIPYDVSAPTPLGYGPPFKMRFNWSFQAWASEAENQKVWQEIMSEHSLTWNPFDDIKANFEFGDMAVFMSLCGALSMNKARYFGWTGHVDTMESLFVACGEFQKLGMLPPMAVTEARPLI